MGIVKAVVQNTKRGDPDQSLYVPNAILASAQGYANSGPVRMTYSSGAFSR
jgi:hypothetical protein